MQATKLTLNDKLPLTCSRTGTCCHGKQVLLNPWELRCLANEKQMTPRAFRDQYCDYGGIRLKFNGAQGWKGQQACSQYIDNFGCSVHLGRPLSCRLYPLGRQIQSEKVHYIFQGNAFPCLEGCPEVSDLPQLSVADYLSGQGSESFENAQDAYLNLMQSIADIAFALFLETGLSESGDRKTLPLWRKMGNEEPEILAKQVGNEWMDCLMLPEIDERVNDPLTFAQKHLDIIQVKAQETINTLQTHQAIHEAAVQIMSVALHLARGLGANPAELADLWVATAKNHGGLE